MTPKPQSIPSRPPAFAGAVSSGCAGTEPPTCVGGLHSGSTGGQPSGSDRLRVLRLDWLRASDLRRLLRASNRLVAIHRACAWRSSFHPARAVWAFLQLGRQPTSDSHRCRSFDSACGFIRLAPSAAPASPPGFRLRIAPAAFTLRLLRPSTARLAPHDRFSG